MDRITDAAKGTAKAEADNDLVAKAEAMAWDLSSRDGLRTAAKDMLELLQNGSKEGKTIDLPKENTMQSIGKVMNVETSGFHVANPILSADHCFQQGHVRSRNPSSFGGRLRLRRNQTS